MNAFFNEYSGSLRGSGICIRLCPGKIRESGLRDIQPDFQKEYFLSFVSPQDFDVG